MVCISDNETRNFNRVCKLGCLDQYSTVRYNESSSRWLQVLSVVFGKRDFTKIQCPVYGNPHEVCMDYIQLGEIYPDKFQQSGDDGRNVNTMCCCSTTNCNTEKNLINLQKSRNQGDQTVPVSTSEAISSTSTSNMDEQPTRAEAEGTTSTATSADETKNAPAELGDSMGNMTTDSNKSKRQMTPALTTTQEPPNTACCNTLHSTVSAILLFQFLQSVHMA